MPDLRPSAIPTVAEHAYELAEPLARHDPTTGWPLLQLFAVLGTVEVPMWQMFEDPGAAAIGDPTAEPPPPDWLIPLEAAINGARLRPSMTDAQRLAELAAPTGYLRGGNDSLVRAALPHMQAPFRVVVSPRSSPDAPGDQPDDTTIRVRADDVLPGREDQLTADVLRAVIGGVIGHVLITNDGAWDDVVDAYDSWAELVAAMATWDALLASI